MVVHASLACLWRRPPPPPPPLPLAPVKLPTREESLVSAAICSLPANDPLNLGLIVARPLDIAHLGVMLDKALGLIACPAPTKEPPYEAPPASTPVPAVPLPAVPLPAVPLHTVPLPALLGTRAATLEALQTTLHRACAERERATQQLGKQVPPGSVVPAEAVAPNEITLAFMATPTDDNDPFAIFEGVEPHDGGQTAAAGSDVSPPALLPAPRSGPA